MISNDIETSIKDNFPKFYEKHLKLKNKKTNDKYNFDSVTFDEVSKTFTIKNGTEGTYSISDITQCTILNEDAKFKGKAEPFLHQVLGGTAFVSMLGEPLAYVGIKLKMKDDSTLAIYVSKEKCVMNSDIYLADRNEAEDIKKIFMNIM